MHAVAAPADHYRDNSDERGKRFPVSFTTLAKSSIVGCVPLDQAGSTTRVPRKGPTKGRDNG